jgi:hypothetical protein
MSGYKRWLSRPPVFGETPPLARLMSIVASTLLVAVFAQACASNGGPDGSRQTAGTDELAILVAWHLDTSWGQGFLDNENVSSLSLAPSAPGH